MRSEREAMVGSEAASERPMVGVEHTGVTERGPGIQWWA